MKTSEKPEWRKTAIAGLYEYRPAGPPKTKRGVFCSRYSVNGKRTFRSLETDVFEHAKFKHAKREVVVEKDRQRGADLGSDFETLGALFKEMEARLAQSPVSANSVVARRSNMARLRTHWQRGAFDTFLARNVPGR